VLAWVNTQHSRPSRRDPGADPCWPAAATTSARRGHLEGNYKRITGSQLAINEDASHLCFAEQPAEFSTIINPS
jgi:hypothetical protein